MHSLHRHHPAPSLGAVTSPSSAPASSSLEHTVQRGLNLFLRLKSPAQMPALLASIKAIQPSIDEALRSLHYVHFARFLPSQDFSTLMVITSYDGDLRSYLMDFVAVLGPAFNAMLMFVQGAPRLPVERYPEDFVAFVDANNMEAVQPWSAYPDMTVLEIQHADSHR